MDVLDDTVSFERFEAPDKFDLFAEELLSHSSESSDDPERIDGFGIICLLIDELLSDGVKFLRLFSSSVPKKEKTMTNAAKFLSQIDCFLHFWSFHTIMLRCFHHVPHDNKSANTMPC